VNNPGGKISKVDVVGGIFEEKLHIPNPTRPRSRQRRNWPGAGNRCRRGKRFLEGFEKDFQSLRREGYPIEILFLESSNPILIWRFSETAVSILCRRRIDPRRLGLETRRLQAIRDMAISGD